MLTSVARAAMRRVLARTPATTSSATTRALPIRSALQFRSFTSSEPDSKETQTAKKPRPAAGDRKSVTAKKAPAKKAAAKKKVAAKKPKKKAPKKLKKKKAVVVKKPKRLTPEDKAAAKLKELKYLALLEEPELQPDNPWRIYVSRNTKEKAGLPEFETLASRYRQLSATEMADLKAASEAGKTANKALILQWVESHAPERIAVANGARNRLRKLTNKKYKAIEDARLPRDRIRSGFNFYVSDVLTGRDNGVQQFKDTTSTWTRMSAEEKRPYNEMAEAEKTLVTKQRSELQAKATELRSSLKQEHKQAVEEAKLRQVERAKELGRLRRAESRKSESPKSEADATNEMGL